MSSPGRKSQRLISEALAAPESVDRVEGEELVIEIQHQPEPGIERRLVEGESEVTGDWVAIVVTPVDSKPQLYPASLPFLPSVSALLRRDGESTSVIWCPPDGSSCDIPISSPPDVLFDVTAQLEDLRAEAERDNKSSAQMADKVRDVFDSLDPGRRSELEAFWGAIRADPTTEAWLDSVFDTATATSQAEGWHVVSAEEKDSPVRSRRTVLISGSLKRTIMMQAISPGTVFLGQEPTPERTTA